MAFVQPNGLNDKL